MIIWYISKYVAPPLGMSIGGRGYEIMRELAAMGNECVIIASDANHLASVPALEGRYLIQFRDGLHMCWLRTMKSVSAKSHKRVAGWISFEWSLLRLRKRLLPRPEVIIVSSLSLLTILNGLVMRARFKARLVVEIRDIWPLTLVEEGGFSRWNPAIIGLGLVERLGYQYADAIVGTMPNLGEHVANVVGGTKRVHCVPMGFSPRAINTTGPSLSDQFGSFVPRDSFVIGYAGTVGITNALESLFHAAEAMQDDKAIHFVIIGAGDLLPKYRAGFAHLSNLTFVPQVPKDAVQSVLAECTVLYLATHRSRVWDFGQSLNKLIDYMLAGKPIVASYSGFPSMINEAGCGSYVGAGDVPALVGEFRKYAGMSSYELDQIGGRGRAWLLEHRSFGILAEKYLRILASLD